MPLAAHFEGKKVLVTGAGGFIGSHVCRRLHAGGAEVHGMARSMPGDEPYCSRWWQGDLADPDAVKRVINSCKPEVVFHLASHVAGARDLEMVLPTFQSNLASTVNLLTAATEAGTGRIILAGSLEEPEAGSPDREIPCSPYAAAKWGSSAYARMFHALYQTPVSIARLFMVYGPAQMDLRKLIPYVTLSLLRRQTPKLTSGTREIDWIYVEDVVDGLLQIARAEGVNGLTIDLGSGKLETIRTIVGHLSSLVDSGSSPLFGDVPDRPMEQIRVADVERSFAKVGWKPATSLKQGLEKTVSWYRDQWRKGHL